MCRESWLATPPRSKAWCGVGRVRSVRPEPRLSFLPGSRARGGDGAGGVSSCVSFAWSRGAATRHSRRGLFAVATNVYCSEIRRIPPRASPLDDVPEPIDTGSHASIEDAYRDHLVRRAVQTLPARYREALTLFYFHDMNVAAAATSLGLPEGTLKARLSRGRALLRRKLSRQLSPSRQGKARR